MHVIHEVAIATQAIQLHIHSDRARVYVYMKISVEYSYIASARTYIRILGPVRVHAYILNAVNCDASTS